MKFFVRLLLIAHILMVGIGYTQQGESETVGLHKSDHAIHWNHLAAFAGATSKFEKEGTHFTLGMDYLRKIPPSGQWALSIFGEAIFEEHNEWLFGIPLFIYL